MSSGEPIKEKITYLGKVDYRGKAITFGIKAKDRTKHMYIIGKSGMGKSTLLENLAIQDINNGEGICVIDPHGSMAEKLLEHIPESRVKDVIYFAPFDGQHPMGLNMLEKVPAEKRYLLANGMMSAFKKIFTDGEGKGTFSARMEYVLNNIILALLENEGQTLLGVNRMLFDKEYRKFIVSNVTDPTVRDFWVNEYANYTDKTAQELAPSIQNKIGQFVSNPLIRNIIGQKKTSFDVRKIMDEKKIFIVNLSKGKVGEGNANLLGSLLITKIYLAAMSRADVSAEEMDSLPPCYFYVDEFQNFANESFASILSEARKYKLALTVAHQYVEQMTDEVKSAVFGNVGTMITFRIGATDAEVFEKEFAPKFILDDFVNLSAYQIYLRLMIDGQGSQPFSAKTLDPIQPPAHSSAQAVIAHSRAIYTHPVDEVEKEIAEFYHPIVKEEKKFPSNGFENKKPAYVPDERTLKVKELKNDSPYPPKRFEDKKRYDDRSPSYVSNKSQNVNPVQNHKEVTAVVVNNSETHPVINAAEPLPVPVKEENVSLPKVTPVHFDDKPATSLKDALLMATAKHKEEIEKVEEKKEEIKVAPEINKTIDTKKPKKVYPEHFDDKPAVSLKDALARAMSENKPQEIHEKQEAGIKNEEVVQTSNTGKNIPENKKKPEEVPEDVLRKLIEEE